MGIPYSSPTDILVIATLGPSAEFDPTEFCSKEPQEEYPPPRPDNQEGERQLLQSLDLLSLEVPQLEPERSHIKYNCCKSAVELPAIAMIDTTTEMIPFSMKARFFAHASRHPISPTITFITLKTALFYVTKMVSIQTSSCLVKMDRELIKLIATQGLHATSIPQPLSYTNEKTIKAIPTNARTVIKHLAI
ncbi:hypothetical protein PCANC_20664 [Puccinia coronata f. sp. avenae]|uniref:Uncharacterized protein n=1 Tax=Puccinia coronata f. sp. avenae TaxID=200324 RepID=A0A2N5UPZ7_9BASI|nr:hypothetical protein PCANC_20664 [Puccinia coronata f. sp. avenae]